MKYWINSIGYSLPQMIRTMNTLEAKGSPLYSQWYGRHSKSKGFFKTLKLILQNGKR
jgi:hypothetical protein